MNSSHNLNGSSLAHQNFPLSSFFLCSPVTKHRISSKNSPDGGQVWCATTGPCMQSNMYEPSHGLRDRTFCPNSYHTTFLAIRLHRPAFGACVENPCWIYCVTHDRTLLCEVTFLFDYQRGGAADTKHCVVGECLLHLPHIQQVLYFYMVFKLRSYLHSKWRFLVCQCLGVPFFLY